MLLPYAVEVTPERTVVTFCQYTIGKQTKVSLLRETTIPVSSSSPALIRTCLVALEWQLKSRPVTQCTCNHFNLNIMPSGNLDQSKNEQLELWKLYMHTCCMWMCKIIHRNKESEKDPRDLEDPHTASSLYYLSHSFMCPWLQGIKAITIRCNM